MIEAGSHTGRLVSHAITESTGDDPKPVFEFEFELPSGDTRTVYLYLSDKAWSYSVAKLQTLGFNGDWDEPAFSKTEDVPLFCKHEEYDGQLREKWDIGRAGPYGKPASEKLKNMLASKWRAEVGPAPAPTTKAPAKPPARASTPSTKQSGPPQRAKAPGINNENEAWEAFQRDFDSDLHNKRAISDVWNSNIDIVATETGVPYERFGPDQWTRLVSTACNAPF